MIKQVLALALFVVVARGQEEPHMNCEDCYRLSQHLSQGANHGEGFNDMLDLIRGPVCESAEDQDFCEEHIQQLWHRIAGDLFAVWDGWFSEHWLCADLCEAVPPPPPTRELLCDGCAARINRSMDYMMDESAILHAVEMVQAGMCMEHEHVDQCVAAVEGILPIALPVLGEANRDWIDDFCHHEMHCHRP